MTKNFTEKDFRECMSHYSTGITIISTKSDDGIMNAVTINSFTSVSLKPPLILFCLDKDTRSLQAFLGNECFGVTILDSSQHKLAEQFASNSENKWEGVNYIFGATGSPIIIPNLSFMECERFASYEAGDHHIIIGKVINLDVAKTKKKNPLIYFRGMYHHSPQTI